MKPETIFPLASRVNTHSHLEIGGCDLVEIAKEHGTPLYVFDEDHLRARALEARDVFSSRLPNSQILYATKAYFSPYLARLFKGCGLGLDVASEGELEIARRVDYPREKIYLHGNNKTDAEIRAAFDMGVDHVIIDNLDEIALVDRIAQESNLRPRVLLRLAPGIDPHTHKYLATSVAESKFGLPMATGDAMTAARIVASHSAHLDFVGLHVHIGSQIFDLDPYRDAVRAILDFAAELHAAVGFELRELDLGGGWGVAYEASGQSVPIESIATAIADAFQSPLPGLQSLLIEPGRALVAQAAVALYTVGSVKEIAGIRTYVSVDGGMGDNIRPALYGAKYTARLANRMNEAPSKRYAIAGRYCEQGDILIENVELPPVKPGDLIVIPVAGAYQLPMASNYNLVPRPAAVAVRNGQARLIRRRETLQDMLSCDVDE